MIIVKKGAFILKVLEKFSKLSYCHPGSVPPSGITQNFHFYSQGRNWLNKGKLPWTFGIILISPQNVGEKFNNYKVRIKVI